MALEGILNGGVTEISSKLFFEKSMFPFRNDLMKLKTTLEKISAVTKDAERRQVMDSTAIYFLKSLKDAVYDAEDVIDDFSYEVMRRSEIANPFFKVKDFFSSSNYFFFRAKMILKIKKFDKKLDEIGRRMSYAQIDYLTGEAAGSARDQIPSSVPNVIVGRQIEVFIIVDFLVRPPPPPPPNNYDDVPRECEKLPVLPIVGMGGIGKTRLAQSVYCDKSVQRHFDLRIWVCLAGDFDLDRILREIVESITDKACRIAPDIDAKVRHVQELLRGKRYLLVLDDLWNEDAKDWEKLVSILMVGSDGCKVLVTTRSIRVAWIVQGITPLYRLKQLSANECWSIIKQKAFSSGAPENPGMVNIGKEIAEECSGLPLAAEILGSVMRMRREEREWASMMESEILGKPECHGSIKFSYDNLTSTLKRCFSYCSVFPRGWEIDRETLIQLWMAEGFLRRPVEISMEDIGNEYFNSFLSQSLFQSVGKDEFGEIQKCKMPDLVYYLAQTVADKDEWSVLKPNEVVNISELRRLRLVCDEDTEKVRFPRVANNVNKLRAFMAIEVSNCDIIERVFNSRNLRVLYMSGSSIQKLPAFSRLRHLRYLNLSGCHNLNALRSINSLYNLQTLVLRKCSALLKLPEDFGSMKNLRHIDLSYTGIKVLPNSASSLCNMRTLDVSHCNNFQELPDKIGAWKDLRSLDISHTQVSVLPDSLTGLHKLVKLRLHSCPNLGALPKGIGALRCSKWLDISGTQITLEHYLNELGH